MSRTAGGWSIPTSGPTPSFQFSITTVFCITTVIAILCFLAPLEGVAPYWTIVPVIFLVAAFLVARRDGSADLAWEFFSIAWVIALINAVNNLSRCFDVLGGPPSVSDLQYRFYFAYSSTLAIPFFLSLPVIYLVGKKSKGSHSYGRKWIITGSIVGIVNVTVLTVWLILFIDYTMPWF